MHEHAPNRKTQWMAKQEPSPFQGQVYRLFHRAPLMFFSLIGPNISKPLLGADRNRTR